MFPCFYYIVTRFFYSNENWRRIIFIESIGDLPIGYFMCMWVGVVSGVESRPKDAEQGISGGISNGGKPVTYIINTGGRPLGQQPEQNQSQGLHQ